MKNKSIKYLFMILIFAFLVEGTFVKASSITYASEGKQGIETDAEFYEVTDAIDLSNQITEKREDVNVDVSDSAGGRFELKTLILTAEDLNDDFGASYVLSYETFNQYFLFFETEEATEIAFDEIVSIYGEESCFPDEVVYVEDDESRYLFEDELDAELASEEILENRFWGAKYMGLDVVKTQYNSEYYKKVDIAIIDSGIYASHDIFKDRIDIAHSYNFYNDNTNFIDNMGHGTHVAGIIADATPENVMLTALRCYNNGASTKTALISALSYAVDELEPDIINMSLGWYGEAAESYTFLDEYIAVAKSKNIVICAASGNKGQDAKYAYPANIPDVITVSAIDKTGAFASYSNYGQCIDFTAPGSKIESTYINGTYKLDSGTSMACPYVAAAVSYIRMGEPDLKLNELYGRLIEYSVDLGDEGWDEFYGYGYLNLETYFEDLEARTDRRKTPIYGYEVKNFSKVFGNAGGYNPLINNSDGVVVYTSSDESVIKVDSDGYINIVGVGTATITARLLETDKFLGAEDSFTVTVSPMDLGRATIKLSKQKFTYDGKPCEPEITINGLPKDCYTVQYLDSDKIGTATAVITAAKNCEGSVSINYSIELKTPEIKSISNGIKGVEIKWAEVAGARGYKVYRKASTQSEFKVVAVISGAGKVEYVDASAISGNTYSYKVKALCEKQQSSFSPKKTIVRLAATKPSVKNISSGIRLKWKKVVGASKYYVYRKLGNGRYKKIATVSAKKFTYIDKKAKKGKKYTYMVRAYKNSSKSSNEKPSKTIRRK